jgi:tRNA dimethylallyltransferase
MTKLPTFVIGGATASGKTALAIRLAQAIDAEIISADSRQFYRGMDIGTAKPTQLELRQAVHHFIDFRDIDEPLSAGAFERMALELHDEIRSRGKQVVITGGSGLYLQALLFGLNELPPVSDEVKRRVEAAEKSEGITWLQKQLSELDPITYGRIDTQNIARLRRAVEVCLSTGQPYSSFLDAQRAKKRPFEAFGILVERPREELYARINERVDAMMDAGLEEEVRGLVQYRAGTVFNTIGYSEWLPYFDGEVSKVEVVEKIKQHSRNYAKRQGTWFRRYGSWVAVSPDVTVEEILRLAAAQ